MWPCCMSKIQKNCYLDAKYYSVVIDMYSIAVQVALLKISTADVYLKKKKSLIF